MGPDELFDLALTRNVMLRKVIRSLIAEVHHDRQGHQKNGWQNCPHPRCKEIRAVLAVAVGDEPRPCD